MKTVVIACGSGVATSTIIYGGVESLLKKSGIPYNLVQCSFTELQSHTGLWSTETCWFTVSYGNGCGSIKRKDY